VAVFQNFEKEASWINPWCSKQVTVIGECRFL
jgi:hypothetical protein